MGRNQYILDMSRQEVREYLADFLQKSGNPSGTAIPWVCSG